MTAHLRIHVSALGYRADRIYVPLIEMKADKVYLLKLKEEKKEAAIKALKEIREKLKTNKIELIEEECKIFEVTEVVKKVKEIILKEKAHHLFFNISSGNTLSSNALTIAAMLYKDRSNSIQLYYKGYDYEKKHVKDSGLIDLPAFQIEQPTEIQQKVLKFISEKPGGVRKKELLNFLDPSFGSYEREEKTKKLTNFNRQVIDKLVYDWKMISITGKGKTGEIKLSEKGKDFVKFI